MSRILIIVFVVLLVLIGGEVGYYFFFQQPKPQPTTVVSTPEVVSPTPNPNQAINDESIILLRDVKKGVLTVSTLTSEFQGKLTLVEKHQEPTTTLRLKLTIQGKNGATQTFYLIQKDLDRTKIFESNNGKINPINQDQLKLGDEITLKSTADLLKDLDNNLIELDITRII